MAIIGVKDVNVGRPRRGGIIKRGGNEKPVVRIYDGQPVQYGIGKTPCNIGGDCNDGGTSPLRKRKGC